MYGSIMALSLNINKETKQNYSLLTRYAKYWKKMEFYIFVFLNFEDILQKVQTAFHKILCIWHELTPKIL